MTLGSSNSTDLTTLLGLTRHYAGKLAADFSDADCLALLNRSLHEVQLFILEAYNVNQLSGASTGVNLVAGTGNYAFPTDYLQINRIEANYGGGTDGYSNVNLIDLRDIPDALNNLTATSDRVSDRANPEVYILNNRLYLKYVPANSVTNGLIIYYAAIQTELSAAGDEPTFPEHFHELLCLLAAKRYLIPKQGAQLPTIQTEIDRKRVDLVAYFAKKDNVRTRKRLSPRSARSQGQFA